MRKRRFGTWPIVVLGLFGAVGICSLAADEESFEARLRTRLKDPAADFWIYDDMEAGYAAARKAGKPLLVSIRCVP